VTQNLSDVVGEGKRRVLKVGQREPTGFADFTSVLRKLERRRAEEEHQVMVIVEGLTFVGWNCMDIDADKWGLGIVDELNSRFFDDFAAGGGLNGFVFRFDVPARGEPAVQTAVVDEQNRVGCQVEDEAGCCDVAGRELGTREGRSRVLEQVKSEVLTLLGRGVIVVEGCD